LWFVFLIFYSYFYAIGLPIAEGFVGMVELLVQTPLFYLSMGVAPLVALLLDVVYESLKTTIRPDETDKARIKEKGNISSERHKFVKFLCRKMCKVLGHNLERNLFVGFRKMFAPKARYLLWLDASW